MNGRAAHLSGWHAEKVKAEVRMKGRTLSQLARDNGFSESYLRVALIRPRYRGEQIIARFLGVKPQDIWPARYTRDGQPKHPRAPKTEMSRRHA